MSNDPVNRFDPGGTCDDIASDADWGVTVCGDEDEVAPMWFGVNMPLPNDPYSGGSKQSQVLALARGYQKAVTQGIISDCDALAGFAGDLANQAQSVKDLCTTLAYSRLPHSRTWCLGWRPALTGFF